MRYAFRNIHGREEWNWYFSLLPQWENECFPPPMRLTAAELHELRSYRDDEEFEATIVRDPVTRVILAHASFWKEYEGRWAYGHINNVMVLPSARGRRIAPLLVSHMIRRIRQRGWRISIQTIETNQPMLHVLDGLMDRGVLLVKRRTLRWKDYYGDGRRLYFIEYRGK